jgi:hypothetical protein
VKVIRMKKKVTILSSPMSKPYVKCGIWLLNMLETPASMEVWRK